MRFKEKLSEVTTLLTYLLLQFVLYAGGFLLLGTAAVLLAQFIFPDYIRVFNENLTEKSAQKLLDNNKYNELLWLLDQKRPTIEKMEPQKQGFFHYLRGEAYSFIGEYQKSEDEYKKMEELFYKEYDENELPATIVLQSKAMFNFRIGNYDECLRIYDKILKIVSQYPQNPTTATLHTACYMAMLNIYSRQSRPDQALALLDRIKDEYPELPPSLSESESLAYLMKQDTIRARRIWDRIDKKELPTAYLLGGYLAFKEYDKARPSLRQFLKERKKQVGTDHPLYAEALQVAIQFDLLDGKYEDAYRAISHNNRILSEQFDKSFIFMSEQQQIHYHARYRSHFDLACVLEQLSRRPEWAGRCYDNALFMKGLLLRSQNRFRASLMQSGDTTLLPLYDRWITLKQAAAALSTSRSIVDRVKSRLKEEQAAKSAKELARHTADWQQQQQLSATTWIDIRRQLSEGETAIEFVAYTWQKQTRYAALLLQPDGQQPLFIPLFADSDPAAADPGKAIWQALSPYLKETHTLYYSPTGRLHTFPFATIETGSGLLTDRYRLYQVSSTREIGQLKEQIRHLPQQAVLFGGLQYDASDEALLQAAADSSGEAQRSRPWQPLRYSGNEVVRIGSLLDSLHIPCKLYTGLSGNEEAFKRLDNRPVSILHLSTHGYFLPDDTLLLSSMSRSGLILAGGNRAWEEKDLLPQIENGLLTAEEIAAMRLPWTRLVVLSACNTGLGKIDNHEGVFGLQRAFKLAGARTLVMSLWPVDDRATAELMIAFYRHWLTGTEMHRAFARAQQEIRLKHPDPYYWAGFVMSD